MESRLLGFPCFPYSVISMACFGSAFHKATITAKARFGNRNHLSEIATFRSSGTSADWKSVSVCNPRGRVVHRKSSLRGLPW